MTTVPRAPERDFARVMEVRPPEWIGREAFGVGGDLGFRWEHGQGARVHPPMHYSCPISIRFSWSRAWDFADLSDYPRCNPLSRFGLKSPRCRR